MPDSPQKNTPNQQNDDDPLLLNEDEKVLKILIDQEQDNISQFEKLLGMIAYAQYSIQKYEFIKKEAKEGNNSIKKEALKILIKSFNDKNSHTVQSLKRNSKIILNNYNAEYLENAKRQEILDPIENIVKENTNFWMSVWASIIATFIYSLLIAIIIFSVTYFLPDSTVKKVLDVILEENTEPIEKPEEEPIE